MNKEELTYLMEDMFKNELSRTGKFKIELYINKLLFKIDKIEEIVNTICETTSKNIIKEECDEIISIIKEK